MAEPKVVDPQARQSPPLEPRVLVCTFAFNEGEKIRRTLQRIPATQPILVVDDGSTDGALSTVPDHVRVLRNPRQMGIGASMKRAFEQALDDGVDVLVIMAGNDKDDPTEIPRLLEPILSDQADFVQGSRFLPGGSFGNMPAYRLLTTRYVHPLLMSAATGKRLTESTNGFRAFRTALLRDPRVHWAESWLDRYELEPYLLYKAIRLGYRHLEVPCTKVYPPHQESYTKMRPITGWWSILRPIFYLALGIKD